MTAVRQELEDRLNAAGLLAKPEMPKIQPPFVLIGAGDPMLVEDFEYRTRDNQYQYNVRLWCVVKPATEVGLRELERTVETVITELKDDWTFDRIGQPSGVQDAPNFLAVQLELHTLITIGEQ